MATSDERVVEMNKYVRVPNACITMYIVTCLAVYSKVRDDTTNKRARDTVKLMSSVDLWNTFTRVGIAGRYMLEVKGLYEKHAVSPCLS